MSSNTSMTSSSDSPLSIEEQQNQVFELFHVATICKNVITDAERLMVRNYRQRPLTASQQSLLVETCAMRMLYGQEGLPCVNENSRKHFTEKATNQDLYHRKKYVNDDEYSFQQRTSMNKSNWQLNDEFIRNENTRSKIFNEINECHNNSAEYKQKYNEYDKLISNDWMEKGSFSRVFPDVVKNLSSSNDSISILSNLKKKLMSNYNKNRIDSTVDEHYPKEKKELIECIQNNISSHQSFNYPNFLELCKIQVNQFYFKALTQSCSTQFKGCMERNGDTVQSVSMLQSMDCSSQQVTPEEISCKNDFLKYFGEFVSENIKLPETQTLVNNESTDL